jgi:hypothetical protein
LAALIVVWVADQVHAWVAHLKEGEPECHVTLAAASRKAFLAEVPGEVVLEVGTVVPSSVGAYPVAAGMAAAYLVAVAGKAVAYLAVVAGKAAAYLAVEVGMAAAYLAVVAGKVVACRAAAGMIVAYLAVEVGMTAACLVAVVGMVVACRAAAVDLRSAEGFPVLLSFP